MTVTTGGRGLSVAWASSGACSPSPMTYSDSRTAWNPNADAISSIMSKSSRWLIVTICPSSLKAKATISLAGTLRMLASSETVMNSVTRTRVFSRSFSSRRFSSWISRKLGPSSRRCTPLRGGAFDRGERARDVLRHGLLVHQRLLTLLALLSLVAPALLQRPDPGGRGSDGPRGRGNGAARRRTRHRLGTHGSRYHRPRGRAERRGGRRRGRRRRGGGRGRERRRLAPRLLGGGQVLEERGRALFERRLLLVVDRLGRLEHFARLELALRLDGRFGLRLRLGRGHLGRRATPPLGARLRRRRDRLRGSLHDPPPLGRCGRVLQLAFLALPARAHQ